MRQIATIRNQDIIPDSPYIDPSNYPYRETARAVLFDGDKVALVYIAKDNYYKLPGGGLEPNETPLQGLRREVLEEVGYQIENIQEIGETLEYKDDGPERQRSFCFTATITGQPAPVQLTDEEKDMGLRIIWADSLAKAILLVEASHPEGTARFIQRREASILRAVQTDRQA